MQENRGFDAIQVSLPKNGLRKDCFISLLFRVVVVTLVNAGRLVTMGIPKGHFGHIFIDEAGHAQEPEAMIPVSGLLDPQRGHLCLAGDPKQLGPILRSKIALDHGLQISLLERLMGDKSLTNYQKRKN